MPSARFAHPFPVGVLESLNFGYWDGQVKNRNESFFDCLIAIETICHLEDKSDFYQEAMRVLVPGGRLVAAEYTLNEVTQTRADEENMRIFLGSCY